MNRKVFFALLTLAMALALTASIAFASAPPEVHIEVDEVIGTSGETFMASGTAVDYGPMCPTGTVDDLSIASSGPPGGAFINLRVLKEFHCADGSGSFQIRLNIRLDLGTSETTARWRVVSGTGDYVNLWGVGELAGTPIVPGTSVHDVYDGGMWSHR